MLVPRITNSHSLNNYYNDTARDEYGILTRRGFQKEVDKACGRSIFIQPGVKLNALDPYSPDDTEHYSEQAYSTYLQATMTKKHPPHSLENPQVGDNIGIIGRLSRICDDVDGTPLCDERNRPLFKEQATITTPGIDARKANYFDIVRPSISPEEIESHSTGGGVLCSSAENWSPLVNDAFIAGLVDAGKPIYLATPPTESKLTWTNTNGEKMYSVTVRELIGLHVANYMLKPLEDNSLGFFAVAIPNSLYVKGNFSLENYITAIDKFRNSPHSPEFSNLFQI